MKKRHTRWAILVIANLGAWCMLGFYGTTGAAPQAGKPPFNNAVEQREEMIRELKEIKTLLKEQNMLLQAATAKDLHHERK